MVLMKCLVRLKGIIIRELRDAKGRRCLNRARETMHETNEKLSKAMVILKKKQIGALEISLIRPKATAEVSVTDVVSRQKAGLHGVFWNISVTHTHGSESGRQYWRKHLRFFLDIFNWNKHCVFGVSKGKERIDTIIRNNLPNPGKIRPFRWFRCRRLLGR